MSPIITSCKRKGVTVILSLKGREGKGREGKGREGQGPCVLWIGFTLITLTLAIGLLSSILRGRTATAWRRVANESA